MPKVLVAGFDTMPGIGLQDVLRKAGCEVIAVGIDEMDAQLIHVSPDAVLIEREKDSDFSLARHIQLTHPEVKIVLCSGNDERMSVFGHDGIDYETDFQLDHLHEALTANRRARRPS